MPERNIGGKQSRKKNDEITLLPYKTKPGESIFSKGALVLEELKKEDNQDFLDPYGTLKKAGMSLTTLILCLDWLYLIDAARVNENGCVCLCRNSNH